MKDLVVQMRCGIGEAERALFSLESIASWETPCDIRILCEGDAVARAFPRNRGKHHITVVRVSRRGSWLHDHTRLWRMGESKHLILMEPGILWEWSEMQKAHDALLQRSRIAVIAPCIYWMFEEQAGEEQWHERVASSHIIHAGVCWERGRLRVQQSLEKEGRGILGISSQLSLWRGEAFTHLVNRGSLRKREEIVSVVYLWKQSWEAMMSASSAFWLAGAYRHPPTAMCYGYGESWMWRFQLRNVWKQIHATQNMVE